jgi:transposase-like protein
MQNIQQIICPNCGSPSAERHHLIDSQLSRTQCHDCDYLLVTCQRTNRVVEAYAPGLDFRKSQQTILVRNLNVVRG